MNLLKRLRNLLRNLRKLSQVEIDEEDVSQLAITNHYVKYGPPQPAQIIRKTTPVQDFLTKNIDE